MTMRMVGAAVGLAVLALVAGGGCNGDDPVAPGDTTAPNAVTDLHVQAMPDSVMTIAWTAPGDDGAEGTAVRYDIRHAATAITAANWSTCTPVATVPTPAAAGTVQSVDIAVAAGPGIYVALKAADEVPNWSGLSNVVHGSLGSGLEVRQLTTDGNNFHPCVNDGVVTWVRWVEGDGDEIYASNLEVAYPALTRLTDNGGQKAYPSSHGTEKIVWQGREGDSSDWEIFVYSANQVPRFAAFTDNVIHDRYPVLAGGGCFVWLQGSTMFEQVRYWNESSHAEIVLSDGCCPTTEYSNEPPTADDLTVVWRTYDKIGGSGHRTLRWRGTITDLTDAVDGELSYDYSLQAGALAYQWGARPGVIRYWDGVTTQAIAEGYSPSLYDGTIAYEAWDGHDWEIRFWDGSSILEITDNDVNDTQPTLCGGLVAWVGRPAGGMDQIFYARLPGWK